MQGGRVFSQVAAWVPWWWNICHWPLAVRRVDLDQAGRPGLGARVHAESSIPVMGVAKSAFRTATHAAQVVRGRSARPLYITAAGMPVADAARLVGEMAGTFRLPDALKLVDRLARGLEPGKAVVHNQAEL